MYELHRNYGKIEDALVQRMPEQSKCRFLREGWMPTSLASIYLTLVSSDSKIPLSHPRILLLFCSPSTLCLEFHCCHVPLHTFYVPSSTMYQYTFCTHVCWLHLNAYAVGMNMAHRSDVLPVTLSSAVFCNPFF